MPARRFKASFITAAGAGVLKSTDGGLTYGFANAGLTTDQMTSKVVISPTDPNTLFVGTASGLFRSTTLGNSWTAEPSLLAAILTIDLDQRLSPPVLYASGLQPLSNFTTAEKSVDFGSTWTPIGQATQVVVDPSTPNSLFTLSSDLSTPLWSPDGGVTWVPLKSGLVALQFSGGSGQGFMVAPSTPQNLFITSSGSGLWRFAIGP